MMLLKKITQTKYSSALRAVSLLQASFSTWCRPKHMKSINVVKEVSWSQSWRCFSTQRMCKRLESTHCINYPLQSLTVPPSFHHAKLRVLTAGHHEGFCLPHRDFCTKQQAAEQVTEIQDTKQQTVESLTEIQDAKQPTAEPVTEIQDSSDSPKFIPIYTFPYIVQARIFSRFKVYHTAFTSILFPIVLYFNYTGAVSSLVVYASLGFFSVAGVMLYIISSSISRIIGRLYIDEKREIVKLSHLTFWSRRKDEYYKVSEIIPVSDTAEKPNDWYVKIKTVQGHKYYLTPKHGKVLKQEEYCQVVGTLPAATEHSKNINKQN